MKMMTPRIARRFVPFLLFFFCADLAIGGAISVPVRRSKSWSETATARILTITDDSGKTLLTRIWDKKTGKPIEAIPAGEKVLTASDVADIAAAAEAKKVAEVKKAEEAKTAAKAKAKSSATWSSHAEFGVILPNTTNDKAHSYSELYNQKSGFGINSIDMTRTGDRRFLRFRGRSFGTWNSSYGSDFDFRDQAQLHVKARFTRTDWDFGTVLDPSTQRDMFSLNASLDRPEMRFHPRMTLNFRGSESDGNSLRAQGSTDQLFPRDRLSQTWHPSNRDFNINLFGAEKRLTVGVTYGEKTNDDNATKIYSRDLDFNGVSDLLQTWRMQDNFTKSTTGKLTYRFSKDYLFSAAITTTSTDNKFDTYENRFDNNGYLIGKTQQGDLHGHDKGWLDGWTRYEEYSLEGHPNDLWDVQATLERREMRNRAEGLLIQTNGVGILSGSDESSTYNKIDEGAWEARADYKGMKDSRIYGGYSVSDREELDDNVLQAYAYAVNGIRTAIASNQTENRYSIFNETENMGFIGMWHRFSPRLDLDIRDESGNMKDNNRGSLDATHETIIKGYDRTRQRMTLRARPCDGLNLALKLARTDTDRNYIGTSDKRMTSGLYATWAPAKAKYTVGAGYSRTTGDITLYDQKFSDKIDTISLNGGYEISKALRADLNLAQTVSGDITRLDHTSGELRLRWALKAGREASLGYAERAFDNRDLTAENFTNRLVFLSYALPL
ncbi:MAG: hypothetical protein HQM09_16955 [Candidatus Riflebacteria bacterium]|nr:hypothetical protein [Candidatus Riflebacteria bacterium]